MSFVESNCGRNSTGRGKFIGRTTEHAEGNERKNRDSQGEICILYKQEKNGGISNKQRKQQVSKMYR